MEQNRLVSYAYLKQLRCADHTRRFSIATTPEGWEVREEMDDRVVRRAQYQDWHRVERACRALATEFDHLRLKGWAEVSPAGES